VACGCAPIARPADKASSLTLPTDGSPAGPVRFGDVCPSLLGWDLSFSTSLQTNTEANIVLTCRDRWIPSAGQVDFGDENGGILVAGGGRLFVPFPEVGVEGFDAAAQGGATDEVVRIIGRPVLRGEAPGGTPIALGYTSVAGAGTGGSAVDFDVPAGVESFAVQLGGDNEQLIIQPTAASGDVQGMWTLDASTAATAGTLSRTPWRPAPVPDSTGQGTINVEAAAGTTDRVTVWWRWNLAWLR